MKDRIKKYVDNLFADVYETKQLRELKEEISANLLERINDLIAEGNSEDMPKGMNIDKKHIIEYIVASAILLFGAMTAGIVYLQSKDLMDTLGTAMPFLLVSREIYLYFGMT